MNNALETLDKVAETARTITIIPQKEKPLPLEKKNISTIYEPFKQLTEKFKILDRTYMDSIYFDERVNCYLPVFATVSVETGSVVINKIFSWNNGDPKGEVGSLRKSNEMLRLNQGFAIEKVGFVINTKKGLFSRKIKEYYKPFDNKEEAAFTFNFVGQIPDDVRKIYWENENNFDSIHLICEAKNSWEVQRVNIPKPIPVVNYDPIMVGVKWVENLPFIFVLAKFNVTPAELYITKEF